MTTVVKQKPIAVTAVERGWVVAALRHVAPMESVLVRQPEIGTGFGALAGKVWRIGLAGHAGNSKSAMRCPGVPESVPEDIYACRSPVESIRWRKKLR